MAPTERSLQQTCTTAEEFGILFPGVSRLSEGMRRDVLFGWVWIAMADRSGSTPVPVIPRNLIPPSGVSRSFDRRTPGSSNHLAHLAKKNRLILSGCYGGNPEAS